MVFLNGIDVFPWAGFAFLINNVMGRPQMGNWGGGLGGPQEPLTLARASVHFCSSIKHEKCVITCSNICVWLTY